MTTLAPELDAGTEPVKKPLPVAGQPLPTTNSQVPPLTPTTSSAPAQPAIPNAPPAPTTVDPMAFQPPPGSPNPSFAPPGGYGTNTAGADANGFPAAPPGTWDPYLKMVADSKAALANGPQPNANQGYRDFTQTATGTAPTVSDAAGKASLAQNSLDDAKAQLPTAQMGARFTDTMDPGTSFGANNPTTSTTDWINNYLKNAGQSPSTTVAPTGDTSIARSIAPPTGPASDVGAGGQQPSGSTLGGVYTPDPIEQAIGAAQTNSGGQSGAVSLTPTTPDSALTNFTIAPGQTADRVKTYEDALNSSIKNVIDPAYDASSRNLNRYNFGAGRGISGEARTSQGDLANQREQRIADLTAQGLAGATTGSIEDAYRNVGIAQQQQGFQAGQQQTGFNQNLTLQELQNAQTQQEFSNALQKLIVGSQGDPATLQLLLAQIFGGQSAQSAESAVRLAGT